MQAAKSAIARRETAEYEKWAQAGLDNAPIEPHVRLHSWEDPYSSRSLEVCPGITTYSFHQKSERTTDAERDSGFKKKPKHPPKKVSLAARNIVESRNEALISKGDATMDEWSEFCNAKLHQSSAMTYRAIKANNTGENAYDKGDSVLPSTAKASFYIADETAVGSKARPSQRDNCNNNNNNNNTGTTASTATAVCRGSKDARLSTPSSSMPSTPRASVPSTPRAETAKRNRKASTLSMLNESEAFRPVTTAAIAEAHGSPTYKSRRMVSRTTATLAASVGPYDDPELLSFYAAARDAAALFEWRECAMCYSVVLSRCQGYCKTCKGAQEGIEMAQKGIRRCDAVIEKRQEERDELYLSDDKGSDAHVKRVEIADHNLEEAYRALASFAGTAVKEILCQLTMNQVRQEQAIEDAKAAAMARASKRLAMMHENSEDVSEAANERQRQLLQVLDKDFVFDQNYHRAADRRNRDRDRAEPDD